MISGERLDGENIERCMSNAATLQSSNKRRLVDESAARGVDQDRPVLHFREPMRFKETTGLRNECEMQADRIRGGEERVEISRLRGNA